MNFRATNDFPCPYCGTVLGEATGAAPSDRPTDGQWTICVECATPCKYVIDGDGVVSLRKPTEAELDAVKQTRFWDEIQGMVDFVKSKPKR